MIPRSQGRRATIVQLPFPSMSDPHPDIAAFYRTYSRRFSDYIRGYYIPQNALWELPLWVAHVAGLLKEIGADARLVDLSRTAPDPNKCVEALVKDANPGDRFLLSPLAQNFKLASIVSRRLIEQGYSTLLGGNMASLGDSTHFSHIHLGTINATVLRRLIGESAQETKTTRTMPERSRRLGTLPDYSLLAHYKGQVPLLRLNASHGCLYNCSFCGDSWSRQLYVVEPEVLEHEIKCFGQFFPDSRLIYVGDKTFGQSPEAVANLLNAFSQRPEYRFIVQTHILQVNRDLIDSMKKLGVVAAEIGFETADEDLLVSSQKASVSAELYREKLRSLTDAGIRVILNVIGGLPRGTRKACDRTLDFMSSCSDAWLFNLYNFVPYPLTPEFPRIRHRIHDWNFGNWREDAPPVFHPLHQSVDESWQQFLDIVQVAHRIVNRGNAPLSAK